MHDDKNSGTQSVSAVFFDTVARGILARHAPPDLRGITVLLPNYHVAQPLAQALVRAARVPALLLPQMLTRNEWAQSVPLEQTITPESCRIALLYQALQSRQWFGDADYWSMAQELLALFDELTESLTVLPRDADEFAAALHDAYQARQNVSLQFEARLVWELWYAMQQGAELDEMRACQQRLARLSDRAERPLFVLRTSDWNAVEQRFLDEYRSRAPVAVFELRELAAHDPGCAAICAALAVREDEAASLREQSEQLRANFSDAALHERLRLFGANSLEEEAAAAAMQVRCWLAEGLRSIAVVAQDRAVARRVRALLERAQVLVSDETGWTFSTLSVSTVLMSWLDALQSDFYHHDLLDLIKSPYIFADMHGAERKAIVYQLEQLLREHRVVAQLEEFIALASDAPDLHQPLARLRQAALQLEQGKRRTLAGWLAALRESLNILAIDRGWAQDDAGAQLLRALQAWQDELAQDAAPFRFNEWRRWLAQQLDGLTYRDSSIDSPVRFTHLAATRWRGFDAVLLLGSDADHLPAPSGSGRWFNDAVRASLNLPTRAARAAQQRDDLLSLLAMNDRVLATWQKNRNGEEGLLSPYLEMLRDLHAQAYGEDLAERQLAPLLAAEKRHVAALPAAVQPTPVIGTALLPAQVSISAYNSLVVCPYQFYARHVLRLNELDEVQKDIEKRDYGERVHDILRRFHEHYPVVSGHDGALLEKSLRRISAEVFADLLQHDFLARAWLARWFKALPAYLDWQAKGEAEGWRYAEAEQAFALELDGVRLRGRIDRMDAKDDARRVLDYKLQGVASLREKLQEPGEDVQLACYAQARGAGEAAFVSIESDEVRAVEPPHDVGELARLNIERLELLMQQLRMGTPAPANGIEQACRFCEMRGLCRKGEWYDSMSAKVRRG